MTVARFLRISRRRMTALVRPGAVGRDIERELAWHLEELTREKIASGQSEDEARRDAAREFGAVASITERSRDARGLTTIDGFVQDARYALRLLRRAPGFTTVAGLALAAGIGATAGATGVIALVLARPLPFPDGDRLITVRAAVDQPALLPRAITLRQYQAWRTRGTTLTGIGAARGSSRVIAADGVTPALRVQTQEYTPSLFALLGVRPEAGRLFDEVDDPFAARARVAVISHRLWHEHYQGAADAIGRRIRVDGGVREIVGILPPGFRLQGRDIDLWIPLVVRADGGDAPARDVPQLQVTARLRPGVTPADARRELDAIGGDGVDVLPLRETLYGWTRPRLITLAAASALLLVLACANVAALLLARGTLRRRELAMRAALGASRPRIARQLLTESLMLGAAAAVPAVVLAVFGQRAVSAALGPPPGLPRLSSAPVDVWVLVVTGGLCVLSSLAFGVLPSATASRVDPADALSVPRRTGRPAGAGASWRAALVALQIALAHVLLITGTLLTISYLRLAGREVNLDPRGLLSFTYSVRAADVLRPLPSQNAGRVVEISPMAAATMQALYDGLKRLPGSGTVAAISVPPVNSLILPMIAVRPLDAGSLRSHAPLRAAYFFVTPDVFATLRTPVVRGREFDARDQRDAPWTIVVNESMANLCWPGQNPVGRRVQLSLGDAEPPREIIGVVRDIPTRLEQAGTTPAVYTSYLQQPARYSGPAIGMFAEMTFMMRSNGDPSVVLDAARRVAAEIAPDRPIDDVGMVQGHLYARLAERRNYVLALDAFALLALLLAIVGIHGTATFGVVGRAHEIAIRKALGARRREILTAVARPAAATIVAGLVVGAIGAIAAADVIAPQLWNTRPHDGLTLAAVSTCLLCAAALGCLPSIRRAIAVDPATRLRAE